MALEWLKEILGDAYTEEIDTKVSQKVGKDFVARKDFNEQKKAADTLRVEIATKDATIKQLQDGAGDVGSLQEQLTAKDAAHKQELDALKMQFAAKTALGEAGARNTTAAMALLAEFMETAKLNDDGSVEGLEQKIKELTEGESTAFLFQKKESGPAQINGAHPAEPGNTKSQTEPTDFEARLVEARKNGNLAGVSAIKREAAEKGIILM